MSGSRVVLGKLCCSLNTPKLGTWNSWRKNFWESDSWNSSQRRDSCRGWWRSPSCGPVEETTCLRGRRISGCLGQSMQGWLFCSSRSVEKCEANSSCTNGICRHLGRWIRRYLGPCRIWWWQLCISRSAQECEAHSVLVVWGDPNKGGDCSAVQDQLWHL